MKNTLLFRMRFSDAVLSSVSERMAMLMCAGLPLCESLFLAAETSSDKKASRFLSSCAKDAAAGICLADSLSKYKHMPRAYVETVRAGESCGRLGVSFSMLHEYYEQKRKTSTQILAAVRYPLFLLVLSAVAMHAALSTVISAAGAFGGVDLPPLVSAMISAAESLKAHGSAAVFAAVIAAALMFILSKTPCGGLCFARVRLYMPPFAKILRLRAAQQFTGTLSMLLSSGTLFHRALYASSLSVDNAAFRRCASRLADEVSDGVPFNEAVGRARYFPAEVVELAKIGYGCGAVSDAMASACAYCENESKRRTESLLSMLEPVLTAVIGAVVMLAAAAVYLPMISLYAIL